MPWSARSTRLLLPALLAVAPAVAAQDAVHEHAHPPHGAGVGRVSFPTSCGSAAAERFERGVAMLHSFWFDASEQEFQAAAEADTRCPMPHWGIAMTLVGNPFTGVAPSEANRARGLDAARRGLDLAAGAEARERGWLEAALALHDDAGGRDYRARLRAHEEALAALHRTHPEDDEAAIFLARAMIANAPLSDLTYARQIEAAAILEPRLLAQPEHPGLAHYTIHAFDAPPIASRGLEAARRYAAIAPDAPHALHMPSHIFTRLGEWDASIETNRRSAAAEPDSNGAVHPMDYLVYAYLQQGRDGEAEGVVARAVQNADRFYGGVIGYNFAAMPARLALERGRWAEAATLRVPSAGPAYNQAVTHFARAVGAARAGDGAAARVDAARLAALRDTLSATGESYWATVVEAQRLAASAWIARAEGDDEAALRLARAAAELEETVEKHPVSPGPLLPSRELLGDLLLALGHPAEALQAYEATLAREPNRARALAGAARAAEEAGRRAEAAAHHRALLAVMERADADRAETAAARAFLARP